MQYQKNIKLDTSERSNFHRDNSNSNIGEIAYMDPIGNQQLISPISIAGGERSIDYNEKPKHRPIIQSVKNDIKNKTNLSRLVEENPIPSVIINMPYNAYSDNNRERSPRDLKYNLRKPKGENIYNIKTMNQKISPNHNIKNNYQTSTNPQFFDSHNFNNSSNDSGSGRYHQIIFDTRGNNISRSPQYLRRERGGIIPLNNMSPNLNNYDDNSYEQKNDIINNNYYYNRNIITTNSQRNISADAPLRFERQLNLNNNKINNIINQNFKYLNKNNINDEINNKYRNKINQNINYNDVKKIMKKFTKIYDPLKNKNGILVESSQVVLPGASDDVFTNRYKVLSKMKRLSNILLSKRKRSINKYKENSNLNKRSRSRTKSQSPLTLKANDRAKSNSPFNKNMPHNKFLYVSLAMISSKGPNAEDRIILRKMRLDKGGVVDLAQEERKKGKYKIKKITKNKNNINFYHTNPKYREVAAKIIQSWWKELKVLYDKKLKKIILIQSVFRGKWVRKNMYDLLYLNYLYICFCRKIEKILSNYIRPYVFDKLFSYKIAEKDALRNIIRKKEKRDNLSLLSLYFNKWHSIIKNQNLKNKLGKQLIDIRKQNENKLNILLAFFNKWRYMTKISNIPKGKNFNIYPLHKINGLCKIMDAAKKYIQKKAIKKIIKQLIKYLSNQLRDNLLRKIISKKNDNTKNFLRNILYLWYSKILNCKKISNEAEAEKLREMRQKILKIILMNFIKHLNQRLLRKYFIRLYSNNNPESINKYLLYEILRKIDTQDLKKNKENIIDIKGKKYKIMKVKKDLKIVKIEDEKDSDKEEEKEDNEQIVDNYEKIIEKINKRKSGEYKEGEDIPEEIKKDLDKIDKNNKKKSLRERSIEKIQISQQEKKYSIKKIKKGKKKEQERDEISEEENEISNEESEDQRKNPKTKKLSKKISKPKIKYIETELNKRKSQPKYEELTPTSSLEQEEESSEPKEKIKYIKKSSVKRISEKREKPYKYIIKKRKSSPVGKRFIKKRKSREEKIPSRSQSEEFEEIEDSFEEGKYKGKHNYRRYSEPIKNRKFHPKRNTYKDNERNDDSLDEYQDKRNKKYIYIEEKPNKKKKHSYKNIIEEYSSDENEESPEEKKKRKSKYIYIKKDKDGNKYIEELISSPSSEEENKNRKRRKTQERPYIKKRKSDIHYNNKIDEVEENEENEDAENEIKKKKEKKKSILDNKINVYDENGNKINNLKKYQNKDGEYMIDLYDKKGNIINNLKKYFIQETNKNKRHKSTIEIYDKKGRRLLDLDKYQNDIDLYDKNGKIIKDIKKYENKKGEIEIPIYDENNNRITDLNKYKNEDGECVIDVYDKNGKIINDLQKYEEEQEENEDEEEEEIEEESDDIKKEKKSPIKIYDKDGKKIKYLEKHLILKRKSIKEKEKNEEEENEDNTSENMDLFDQDNRKILDLKKYKNKDGDIIIDVFNKDGKKIKNINNYKDEDGNINLDIYDKNGNRLIDLKKYIKEEKRKSKVKEIFDNKGRRLIDLDKNKDIELYDKNGKRITNLKKYINKNGDITIPIYDKNNNKVSDLKKYKNENGEEANVFDKNGKIINNLKNLENIEEEENEESEEKEEEEDKKIDIYDKNGKIIKDLKKYENIDGEIDTPIYDKDKRRILDLKRYSTKDGTINIDVFNKDGNKIKNINNYKDEDGNIDIDIYDKNGNRLIDLKKYTKDKKRKSKVKEYYDKEGNKITNLKKYKNEKGDIIIPIYDKKGNRLLDLDKEHNKINIYDENGNKINDLKKYRNKDGGYNIDLYDKDGKKIIDLKKYKKEKEIYDKEGNRLLNLDKYIKNENPETGINLYDKSGKIIKDLKKYVNKEGEIMIPLYDENKNRIIDLKKYKTENGEDAKVYDKNGKIIDNLKNYENIEEEEQEESEEEEEKEEKPMNIYDKNGKIIKDLKKYENEKGEIDKPIYDENKRRILDLKRYSNKDGIINIDVYNKNGNKIQNINDYKNKDGNVNIDIYDKYGNRLLDFKKYTKEEKEKSQKKPKELKFYDKKGNKINNLKRYSNKEGDIIIPVYDKKGNRIMDLDKSQNNLDVYDENGKKINNLQKYKNKDGEYNIDLYDKDGKKIIDLKKYKKEKEIYDKDGNRLLNLDKYIKNENPETGINLYDKNGKIVKDLKKYVNKEGEVTIPLYDENKNKIIDLKTYKNENGEEANIYDKNGKIINNLKNLEKIEEEEIEESQEEESEKEGGKQMKIYDKNGKIIKDLKKYENKKGEIDTPIYDKNKRRILDLKRFSTKEGIINIDVYNKDGNKIKNINNYKDEDGNIDIDIYDKNGNRLIDLKKYTKDEKRKSKVKEIFDEKGRRLIDLDKNKDEELFDENGKKITNLKKYINKNGDITIPLYDKNNNQVLDLKKYKNENGENANVYDKNGKIINNLKNYENIEEEEQEESEEESEEENEEKTINIYDKNGIIITDLKKYENNKGEIEMPIYDENNRTILDLKNYKNEDGDLNIDLYDKDGNKIKNINKFKDEDGNIIIDIYDKNGNRLIDLKKYIKEEKDKDDKAKYYDKEGNKITNLKKYKNEEGDITIPVYDKKGNRIIDLDNKQNELNIYDENGKKISNLKKYKNEDGEYNIALYDKEGNKIIDLKKYKKDENEKFKKRHSEMIRYKTKEGKYSSDIYDKRGSRITNLSQYKNKDGQITIPIYDAHRNSILSLERKSPKKKEYEQVNITRYNINPKDENKNLDLLTQQGEEYIPYYNKKNENSKSKIKPITLIGEKTELNKMVEKYNFLRKFNFSLNNLSEEDKKELIDFEPKKALLLDLLNDKEQKLKLFLWKYFCIWRGNAINKYNDLGDFLKFVKGQSLTNLRGDFIETLKSVKNPRLYSIALKKFLMNLFHKNIDLLRDAFNRWKKVIYKDNINSLKSKFFYSLCKQNDKKINEKDDGVSTSINNVDNLRKKKKLNLSGPYPPEVKNILSLYFQKWRGARGISTKKFFYGDRTLSLPDECKKYIFKKDKISEDFIKALLSNIPEKDKDEELKKFIKHPLRRMVVLRYRRERLNILRFLLRWYNKVRLILAINHLDRLIQGREKLTKLMRFKPSKILYKKMKLMNPKFYKSKGEKLIQILLDITKYRPFKKFINNMKLFNRVNQLNKILPKVNEKVSNYLLKKYLQKWKLVVEELKEQKIKLLLTYVKKKIKDEKKINHQRKNELLKRILLNLEKNKLNKLLLSFKVWHKIAKVLKEQNSLIREKEGNLLTIIKGKEKIINANYIKKGGEINIKLKKNEQGEFTIDDIINKNLTEEERQAIIKKKIPATINLIDDKLKSLLQMKLYKWKNITNKIICDKNARTIQKFIRIKLGNRLWKKRNNYFGNLSKKYLMKKIGDFAKINRLNKTMKKLLLKKILDNLRKNSKDKNCIISLNENIINANDELRNKNKKIAMKQILKLYTYITLKKLFENLKKMQRSLSNKIFAEFLSKLKEIKLIKSEYNYEKQISNEAIPYRKKMSFAKKKSSSIIQQKEINKSIPYISLLPHLMKFLDEKIRERKTYVIKKLNQSNKAAKLYNLFSSYINKKLIQDKKDFFKIFIKSATKDEKQNDLYKLLRKYFITKKLFVNIEGPSRLLKIFYLIKLTVINQDISDKRWLRALIRKWRFLSFSKSVFKNKMSILYKNFHVNYLEMVNDVFGEEERDNPSVIKEFERFGSNVGMWENEHPDFVEESKFCKNVQKKFKFYRPKEWESRNSQIKIEESKETNEEKDVNEIKEIKKDKIKKYEEVKENNNITEEKKAEPKEPKRKYFRRSFKQNK